MAKNIPGNENQRPPTKATLPSKALNQDRRPIKEFPRQKKDERIHLLQTINARDTTWSAFKKREKKSERREEHR